MARPKAKRTMDRWALKKHLADKRIETFTECAEVLGCSRSYVRYLANGNPVSDSQALRLAGLLGADVDALFPVQP